MKFFKKAVEDEDDFGMASQMKQQATIPATADKPSETIDSNPVIHNTHEQPQSPMPTATTDDAPTAPTPTAKYPVNSNYGVQEIVALMQTLPDAPPELVMPIVIKTLESANIDVISIINEVADNEEEIENNCVDLISKIETLELQIADMNDQIMAMHDDLESIGNVKDLLLSSIEEDDTVSEDSSNDVLISEIDLTEEDISDEMVEQIIKADSNLSDIKLEEVVNNVDKLKLAQ